MGNGQIKEMKILLCCHLELSLKLGGAKVYLEAAKSYEKLGHEIKIIGYNEIVPKELHNLSEEEKIEKFPNYLKSYIEHTKNYFDIIEYEYLFLPFERSEINTKSILVARSVLLIHHLEMINFPIFRRFKSYISYIFKKNKRKNIILQKIEIANNTLRNADLITVPNDRDKSILIEHKHPESKIVIAPYGLLDTNKEKFHPRENSKEITFIGTFDNRKGAVEFPLILKNILKKHPTAKLNLLGTSAMFPDKESVLNYFPRDLRGSINVVTRFDPKELIELIDNSYIGIFPSYLESFGFGALELMSHGIPVIAFDCPGPHMFIPKDLLCKTGDVDSIVRIALTLLDDKNLRDNKSEEVFNIAKKYDWETSSKKALDFYQQFITSYKQK